MKTRNTKLSLNKNTIIELNNDELLSVNAGGTSTLIASAIILIYLYH